MENTELSKRVRDLRKRNGISQEKLAENSRLSLRTIQRIESGETTPRGETLKRLSETLNVSPNEIIEWDVAENKEYISLLNLSSISFILFPLIGIIIPVIMWIYKKDKIRNINQVAFEVINFQITWCIFALTTYMYFIGSMYYRFWKAQHISAELVGNPVIRYSAIALLYLINIILIVDNTIRINKDKEANYRFRINFFK